MTLKGMIDRFEGDWAVIELDGQTEALNVSRKLIPKHTKEGDTVQLKVEDGQIVQVEIDAEAIQVAWKRILNKLARLRLRVCFRGARLALEEF